MSNNKSRYQPFVAVSGNLGGKVPFVDDVPSSLEQETYRTTSLDENCIEFEFQTDRNYYVDLRPSILALKIKFVKGVRYDTYESQEKKKEQRWLCYFHWNRRWRRRGRNNSSYLRKQPFAFNVFQMLKCTLTISSFTIPMDSMLKSLIFRTTSRQPSLITRKFCIVKAMTMNKILRISVTPYLIIFYKENETTK